MNQPDPDIELTLAFHKQTELAVLVSLEGDGHSVWLPKSRIIVTSKAGLGRRWMIRMPQSLAREKGLLARAGAGQQRLF